MRKISPGRLAAIVFTINMFAANNSSAGFCSSLINDIKNDVNTHAESLTSKNTEWMNLNWLTNNLGTPTKSNISDNVVQYEWKCRDVFESTLNIKVNNKKIIAVEGQANSSDGSEIFSSGVIKAMSDNTQKRTISPADTKIIAAFIDALENCTPGTYTVNISAINKSFKPKNMPDMIATYKISGPQNDKCIMDVSIPNTPISHCAYSRESLNLVVRLLNHTVVENKLDEAQTARLLQECSS